MHWIVPKWHCTELSQNDPKHYKLKSIPNMLYSYPWVEAFTLLVHVGFQIIKFSGFPRYYNDALEIFEKKNKWWKFKMAKIENFYTFCDEYWHKIQEKFLIIRKRHK